MTGEDREFLQTIMDYAEEVMPDIDPQKVRISEQIETAAAAVCSLTCRIPAFGPGRSGNTLTITCINPTSRSQIILTRTKEISGFWSSITEAIIGFWIHSIIPNSISHARRHISFVVVGIQCCNRSHLFQITDTVDCPCFISRTVQCGEEHPCQNGNDCNHH